MKQLNLFDPREMEGTRACPGPSLPMAARGRGTLVMANVATTSIDEEDRIRTLMHTTDQGQFQEGLRQLMTEEESAAMTAAEALGHAVQVMHLVDSITRRLTLRFARLSDWNGLAEILAVETVGRGTRRETRCIQLDLGEGSRNLRGHVVFRIAARDVGQYRSPIPSAVIQLLRDSQNVFTRLAIIEPLFDMQGRVIRDLVSARKLFRPVDPIILGYLGPAVSLVPKEVLHIFKRDRKWAPAFIVAHWE